MGHSMRAVKPAAKRALIYLIVAAIMSGIGFWWLTDGLTKRPTWEDLRPWLAGQEKP